MIKNTNYYCPYHGKDHPEETTFTEEHIVPFAAGGSNEFVIRVCKEANDRMGAEVDTMLLDNFFIASERVFRRLKGQSGAPPTWTFHGEMEIAGRKVRAKYTVSPEEQKLFMKPLVERTGSSGGDERFRIECSEEQMQEIVAGINRKLIRDGRAEVDLDAILKTSRVESVAHPSMVASDAFDTTSFHRPFVKMALGTAHFLFGEQYSRTRDADLLRRFLWTADAEERKRIQIGGQIWPTANSATVPLMRFGDWHVIAILNTGPLAFFGLLFGQYHGCMKLSEDVGRFTATIPAGDGIVFLVDPAARTLRQFRLGEFLAKKQRGQIV